MRCSSILIPFLICAAGCSSPAEKPAVENSRASLEENLKPREVRLIKAEIREEKPSLEVVGEIRPFDEVEISSEVAGRVQQLFAEVGDRVRKDDLLCRLDPTTFDLSLRQAEAALEAARANLELARKELDRKKDLVSDHTIPQADFDRARAQADLAEAQVREAEAARGLAEHRLKMTGIRAPSPGAVTLRMAAVGQWVDVGQSLLEMATGSRIKVVARIPSSWAEEISGLESFSFSVGTEDHLRSAKIYSIDPVINEASRSFELVGAAPAEGIKAGAFARIHLQSSHAEKSLWLPIDAVVISDTPRVLMVRDSKIVIRRVQTGLRSEDRVEILSGLSEDEEVVSSVAGLSRDLPVKVIP